MSILVVQPSLPHYRIDFFRRLSESHGDEFRVYYSNEVSSINVPLDHRWAQLAGTMREILPGLYWQKGVVGIRLRKEDIVVISGAPRCLSNIALLVKAKAVGAKTVWWGHYWSSTSKNWRFVLRLLIMRLSDAVIFYTDQEVEEYRQRVGRKAKKFVIGLNNGLNTEPIRLLRRTYNAASRPMNILFVGRFTKKSNLNLLIQALASPLLAEVFLQVIGDGDERESIVQLAKDLGVFSRVILHGPITDEYGISEIANQCRIFVYPGEVGLSLIHGMAYGLPAVVHSNRRKHMPEIAAFKSGVTGEVFDQDNADSLARVLGDLLHDIDRLNCYSGESLKIIGSSFNTADMASRFFELVKEVAL